MSSVISFCLQSESLGKHCNVTSCWIIIFPLSSIKIYIVRDIIVFEIISSELTHISGLLILYIFAEFNGLICVNGERVFNEHCNSWYLLKRNLHVAPKASLWSPGPRGIYDCVWILACLRVLSCLLICQAESNKTLLYFITSF